MVSDSFSDQASAKVEVLKMESFSSLQLFLQTGRNFLVIIRRKKPLKSLKAKHLLILIRLMKF